MTRRTLPLDTGIAALLVVVTVAMLQGGGFGTTSPGVRPLDGLGVVLAVASALPLAARRVSPMTVYGVTAAASLALDALDYGYDFPFGPLVGVYSVAVAYSGDPRPVRRWTAILATNLYVPATAAAYAISGSPVGGILAEMLLWALLFAGAWIAGDRARLRGIQVA